MCIYLTVSWRLESDALCHVRGFRFGEGILGAVLSVGIFLGKMCGMMFFFMWIRWTLPRFRYDQVMKLGWKVLLPLSIANLVVYTIFIFYLDTKL